MRRLAGSLLLVPLLVLAACDLPELDGDNAPLNGGGGGGGQGGGGGGGGPGGGGGGGPGGGGAGGGGGGGGDSGCTEGYSPCLPPAPDYDCAGGSGDGPEYSGTVTVTGSDPYGLDSDDDGVGCE